MSAEDANVGRSPTFVQEDTGSNPGILSGLMPTKDNFEKVQTKNWYPFFGVFYLFSYTALKSKEWLKSHYWSNLE